MAKYRVRILYRKFSMTNYLTQDIEIESTPEDIEKVASDLYTDFMKYDAFGYEIETCGYSIAKITPKKENI